MRQKRLLPAFVTVLAFVPMSGFSNIRADEKLAKAVLDVVQAKDFWEKAGKRDGRKWSDQEIKQLDELAGKSKDGVVRLRAGKILVDLEGNSRFGSEQQPIVIAGFRYLEAKLKDASVKKLCVDQGFTHYTVSTMANGSSWFLIEHVRANDLNGGLNLAWDSEKKAITGMQTWGSANP